MKKICLCVAIDILGFKSLVARTAIEEIRTKYLGLLQKSFFHSIRQEAHLSEVVTLEEINNQSICDVVWFSDSIFLFLKDDTDYNIYRILSSLSWLLFETNLGLATKLRCGISYGEVFLDFPNQIFFGQPIIDAHELEASQDWSGGALDLAACQRISKLDGKYLDAVNRMYIVDYAVPTKKNMATSTKAINWTTGIHNYRIRFLWNKESEDPSETDWLQSYEICKKYVNTRKFHTEICAECKQESKKLIYDTNATTGGFID